MPISPECAGSAGEGRRRARQCHGLNLSLYHCVAMLPFLHPRASTRQERGSRVAEGRSGVAHKLLWQDCESTRVGPQNVGGGSQDPVTRCWECVRRGGQTSARKLLPFYFQFFYEETFKNDLHTQMVFWGGKESGLEMEFFLRL